MPLWRAADPLLLASRSKVRQTMLAAAGVVTEVQPADIDERGVEAATSDQTSSSVAALLAATKATATARNHPGRLVLGADQILALGAKRFAKPTERAAAREQLRALRGQTHTLHSAIAFVRDGAVLFTDVGITSLTMRSLSDDFIDRYLDAVGEAATTSVGAYQIEGLGIQLFERLDGDYFTILGLPLIAVLDFLRRSGCLVS